MTLRAGVGVLTLALAGSCTCRTLEELEMQQPSSCSPERPCAEGWRCSATGTCAKMTGGACSDGETQRCGSDAGECEEGTRTCASGMFGACVGEVGPVSEVCDGKDNDCNNLTDDNATDAPPCPLQLGVCAGKRAACGTTTCNASQYGADYEVTETRCDGKDNDCNGSADLSLTMLCAEQRGVCAGARATCLSGAFELCTGATFLANNASYQSPETSCDGRDNDCDGLTDAWPAIAVSGTAGRSRSASAVTASTGDVVVLWEEEIDAGSGAFKVRSRVVTEGGLSPLAFPSFQVTQAVGAAHPAVAADGTDLVAAWDEETSGGSRRLSVVSLDPNTGRSNIPAEGAQFPLSGSSIVQPNDVAIAVDSAGQRVLVAVVDGSALNLVRLVTPLSMSQTPVTALPAVTGVLRVQLATAGNRNFWLTYENALGQVVRCLVADNLNRNCSAQTPVGKSPGIAPLNAAAPFAAASHWLQDVDAGVQRIALSTCTDGGTCTAGVLLAPVGGRSSMSALNAAATSRTAAPTLFAWEEGLGASAAVRYVHTNRDAGVQPAGASPGRRPQALFLTGSRHALVFDTDGSSGGTLTPSEVYLSRFCY